MELIVRMRRFTAYPAGIVRMSKKYFWSAAVTNVHAFLNTDITQLDVGVGLQLHALAWQQGQTEASAAAWLLSPPRPRAVRQTGGDDACKLLGCGTAAC